MSFDRSSKADRHTVNVFREVEGKREKMTDEDIATWLQTNKRTLPPRKWIEPQLRASGLLYDIAIDLRTLFCVSVNQMEPEVYPETLGKIESKWLEGNGKCFWALCGLSGG